MTHARLFGVTAAVWLGAQALGCGRSDLLSWDEPGEFGGGSSGADGHASGSPGGTGASGSGDGTSGAARGDAGRPADAGSRSGAHSGASADDGSPDDGPTMVFTGDDSTPMGDGSNCGAACPGCCLDGLCVSGLQELACGRGGEACTVCSAELSCALGFCQ